MEELCKFLGVVLGSLLTSYTPSKTRGKYLEMVKNANNMVAFE